MTSVFSWLQKRAREWPDSSHVEARSILLASEGRMIPPNAVDLVAEIALRTGASIHVMSIARVWGTALGFPHPGLMPTKREWRQQHDLVGDAIGQLKRHGVTATGQVVSTRAAAKRIIQEARARNCDVIVMGADAPRKWLLTGLMWADEPHRVLKSAGIPVYLVRDGSKGSGAPAR